MIKINRSIIVFFFCLLGWSSSMAQSGANRAEDSYEKYAYIDAIKLYERIASRGKADANSYMKLGNAYYFNGQYDHANKWYSQLFTEYGNEEIDAEYYYRYAETLKNTGDTTQADKYFDRYAQMIAGRRSMLIREQRDYMSEIQSNSGRYNNIQPIEVNSPSSDYGSTIYNNQLLFATARDTGNFTKRIHTWTGDYHTSIFAADINEDGSLSNAQRYSSGISSKYNESTPVITKDGKTMYFTRNNYDGSRGYDHKRSTLLKIYRATKDDNGKWCDIEEIAINSDEYSTAHPMLNAEETVMYFVSDRPGGFGSSDLWRVAITEDGFGTPQNLGANINTEGRETFPFLATDNVLYFSSDGRPGLGGLDVFAVKIKSDGTYTDIQNVGSPINSEWDDFGYIIDAKTQQGFFSSNRKGDQGNDDIYRFNEDQSLRLECLQNLEVKVIDAETGKVIDGAMMTVFDGFQKPKKQANQSTNGYTRMLTDEECDIFYRVQASADDYLTNEAGVTLAQNAEGVTQLEIALEPEKIKVVKGDDLFKKFNLNPIYFDLDKSTIRPDAAEELVKILAVLEEYPTMVIDIRSHTDSRATHAYNDRLSDRRAQSTRQWLIDQGISPSRLTAKGYGERQLINECADGVQCTDEEHQANRRSEFIVVDL